MNAPDKTCMPYAEAERIEEAENRIREAVRGGMRLDEARKLHRYHQLQTREQ